MNVTKRDGSTEPLSIEKIHKVAQWATTGLDVSQSELEVEANLLFFDGIKTATIHDALISAAAGLNSVEAQDYTFVAARLLLQKLYKETSGSIEYPHLASYIHFGVFINRLSPKMTQVFDLEVLDNVIDPSRDMLFTYIGLQTIADRYLIRDDEDEIIELPQHFFMRVAMGLAQNESNPTSAAVEFYNVLSSHEFINSTPTLFNSGTLHEQLASCFLNTVADSISNDEGKHRYASIFGTIEECANLSKYAGGIGTDWHRVRGTGDRIKGTDGKSSGIVPYLKVYNDTAVAVNQCFAPDTLIRVPEGVKRIADIKIGDLVLGQRGAYREVREVMSYSQKDAMVSIKPKYALEPLIVTSGHPIYAIQGIEENQSLERTLSQITAGKYAAEWVEAGELKKGDYVAQVIPDEIVPVEGFTEDDARLYGIMLGDGHCAKKSMIDFKGDDVTAKEWGVTGSSSEEKTLVFVAEYLTARGLKYGYSTVGSGATQIKWSFGGKQQERDSFGKFVSGVNCLPFDYEDLYDGDGNKRISQRLSHLPLNQALAIVQGLIDSDGCISRGKEISFTNTSIKLIEGLRYQLLRLGIPTAGNKKVRSNEHLGYDSITTSWDVRIPAFAELAQIFGIPSVTKFNWFRIDNMIFGRVSSVTEIEPISIVHDLKVDGDATYSTTSALVHNGGKRNGAFAAYIEPMHPDLYDFIDLKKESGDDRRRTHDIFPALWIPDLFMQRVKDRGVWSFFSPNVYPELHETYGDLFEARFEQLEREGKFVRQVPALDVWKKVINGLFETGHPWLTFKDTCNRRNPQQHAGMIHNSNLCTEITLNTSDDETAVCNIGSINMSKIKSDEHLRKVVRTAMRMLDNVIDITFYPSERAANANKRHRPAGLGVMGYTEYLVKRGIDWESQEHLEAADEFMEKFSYYAIEASSDLAAERGLYESFSGSLWSQGILPIDTANAKAASLTTRKHAMDWNALREKVQLQGMRNSNTMAIAPTATISNIVGTTATIEPIYQREVAKKNMSGLFIVTDPCLRYGDPSLCKEAFDIDPIKLILAAAVRQKWLDQAQSTNIFVKGNVKGRDLDNIYMTAWEYGLKTTYYLRGQSAEMTKSVIAPVAAPQEPDEPVNNLCSLDNPDCEACQ
ncbi:ribonucleoside-diphosphate reductase subunit alpha [Undibacterium sp. 5I1]|uniref:ribonucleoside-diphosphate reductase subunit alpha n=2 Tax=Undibacterium TaxID=401469 RepID=UPI002AB401B1|nr:MULTISPECIES: ribonucleoside-diphosphate reductase subunit alpha [unclassified Undibacterium]MDY7537541.1 ribonucleoside-diphosphate reductase subunit alpha [Undibacterium sp. 5I1]MEB0231925.1 ribonucleoside-diphosphate reductase subunit alpha [Undibacterium sp. 10I3]MEB0256276.1 ribonucleoside-diphosphate reductase subunit alpha [Undibacterium sp. 5I1]